jgi:16S rRNA G527 N7-methylase RsmG
MNILENGLSCLGFDEKKRKAVLPQLEAYVSELLLFNKVYDLVGTNSRDEIYTRHILDSLAPFTIIQTLVEELGFSEKIKPCFVDIGSGAGLPGMVIKRKLEK